MGSKKASIKSKPRFKNMVPFLIALAFFSDHAQDEGYPLVRFKVQKLVVAIKTAKARPLFLTFDRYDVFCDRCGEISKGLIDT